MSTGVCHSRQAWNYKSDVSILSRFGEVVSMYVGGITFSINKSFGHLQLVPAPNGLRLYYIPILNGVEVQTGQGCLDLLLPIESIGGLWATSRAFLQSVESLDENIVLHPGMPSSNGTGESEAEILVKLYRDKPRGVQGRLTGEETCWLRIVTGRTEEERRRIKLGPRDLLALELACQTVLALAANAGAHLPRLLLPTVPANSQEVAASKIAV